MDRDFRQALQQYMPSLAREELMVKQAWSHIVVLYNYGWVRAWPGIIHHSDQGVEYGSSEYLDELGG